MSSEQVNSLGLLLLSLSYHTSLLLFRPHELCLEDGADEAPEERLQLVNVIQFIQVYLVELCLDGSLGVLEDEGYLVDEALPYDEHRLVELAGRLQGLELFRILVLQDEVEAIGVVKSKGEGGAGEDGVLQLLPSTRLALDPAFYLLQSYRLDDALQGRRSWMLVGAELPQFGGLRQGQVLDELGDSFCCGDDMCHGEFPLGDIGGDQQEHGGDEFLFVVGGCPGDYLSDVFGQVEGLFLQVAHNK